MYYFKLHYTVLMMIITIYKKLKSLWSQQQVEATMQQLNETRLSFFNRIPSERWRMRYGVRAYPSGPGNKLVAEHS